jgi:hypothetical protein
MAERWVRGNTVEEDLTGALEKKRDAVSAV